MRKLMTMVVGVVALCGMTAVAQPVPSATPGVPPSLPSTVAPMGINSDEIHLMRANSDAGIIHRAMMEGVHDPATLELVAKALTDRTTLLKSELDRVAKFQALVTALQAGDKAAVETAKEAVRTSTGMVVANAKAFSQDCKAIREHLQRHGRPPLPPSTGATPGTTGKE
jgi:hypothetical protein